MFKNVFLDTVIPLYVLYISIFLSGLIVYKEKVGEYPSFSKYEKNPISPFKCIPL